MVIMRWQLAKWMGNVRKGGRQERKARRVDWSKTGRMMVEVREGTSLYCVDGATEWERLIAVVKCIFVRNLR